MASKRLKGSLPELHDPSSGRLDVQRVADYLGVSRTQLTDAIGGSNRAADHTTKSPVEREHLLSIKRSLDILSDVIGEHTTVLAWLNSPHPDLAMQTPMQIILASQPRALEQLLENAVMGIPS